MEYKEKELQHRLANWLSEWFYVRLEVSSTANKRLDIIATCKQTNLSYGIELKKNESKRGEEIGKWIKQAHEYSSMQWPDYGVNGKPTYSQIPIFVYPRISYTMLYRPEKETCIKIKGKEYYADRHCEYSGHHTVTGLLGVFNVGELRYINSRKDVGFVYSNKVVWTNKKDYHTGKAKGTNTVHYKHIISKITKPW